MSIFEFMVLINLLYSIYKWIFAYPILVVITIIVTLLITFGSLLFGSKWWGYYPALLWGKCWCWLLFVKIEVRGRENIDKGTSYVFVANHQGAYDIFTIYGYLGHNFKWMMKKSLEKIPFVGMACRYSEQIMVDRSSPMAMARSVVEARKRLCNGMSLVVFPEGTRTIDGKMLPFKKGAFKLAMDFKLPLVPITIDGAYKILPRTSKFDVKYGKIILTIHRPIMPNTVGKTDLTLVMKETYDTIQSALPKDLRSSSE